MLNNDEKNDGMKSCIQHEVLQCEKPKYENGNDVKMVPGAEINRFEHADW